MIVVNEITPATKKIKTENWPSIKHPVLVEHTNGNVYLTVPLTFTEEQKSYDYERDCICLISYNTEKVGNKVYKLNLEYCQLYKNEVRIKNDK